MLSTAVALFSLTAMGLLSPTKVDPLHVNVEKYRSEFNARLGHIFNKSSPLSGPFPLDAAMQKEVSSAIKNLLVIPGNVTFSDQVMGTRKGLTIICGYLKTKTRSEENVVLPYWGMIFPSGNFGPMGDGTLEERNIAETLLVCESWGLKLPDVASQ